MYFEDQEMQDSTATEGIENLVLSFLQQLVDASAPADTTEKMTAQQRRAKSKIQLQLSNRTNGSSRTLTYPRKCLSGSARPFGEWIICVGSETADPFMRSQHNYSVSWTSRTKLSLKTYP